jgi:hypothetical protein
MGGSDEEQADRTRRNKGKGGKEERSSKKDLERKSKRIGMEK